MKRQGSEVYVERRVLPLLRRLLRDVRCRRCGRSGDEHANADHFLEDPEEQNQPKRDEPVID